MKEIVALKAKEQKRLTVLKRVGGGCIGAEWLNRTNPLDMILGFRKPGLVNRAACSYLANSLKR